MLCAEDELGLGDDHDGILILSPDAAPLGADRRAGASGCSTTGARGQRAARTARDLLGHLGVARELCAVLRGTLVLPAPTSSTLDPGSPHRARGRRSQIREAAGCPRYIARMIDGRHRRAVPARDAARACRAAGCAPISNLVDVTNYVMFELGQPLHAFDLDTLRPAVISCAARTTARR